MTPKNHYARIVWKIFTSARGLTVGYIDPDAPDLEMGSATDPDIKGDVVGVHLDVEELVAGLSHPEREVLCDEGAVIASATWDDPDSSPSVWIDERIMEDDGY